LNDRRRNFEKVGPALAALDDAALGAALATATPVGQGIGGPVATMDVEGVPVFVKSLPLTELERQNPRSTANLFALPLCFHYGISSAGFGAWRELAAHEAATGWVLSGACAAFPLLFHARVLPRTPVASPDTERRAAAWRSPEVRRRLEALDAASSRVVLFLECFPESLQRWLGKGPTDAELVEVERQLLEVTGFLRARGVVHFDAHFDNVLTDGQTLFLSDFGQLLKSDFALTADETKFLERHRDYDRSFVVTKLGRGHSAVAALMNGFFAQLRADRRTAELPTDALCEAWK
jgi:hypothetical protein